MSALETWERMTDWFTLLNSATIRNLKKDLTIEEFAIAAHIKDHALGLHDDVGLGRFLEVPDLNAVHGSGKGQPAFLFDPQFL